MRPEVKGSEPGQGRGPAAPYPPRGAGAPLRFRLERRP